MSRMGMSANSPPMYGMAAVKNAMMPIGIAYGIR